MQNYILTMPLINNADINTEYLKNLLDINENNTGAELVPKYISFINYTNTKTEISFSYIINAIHYSINKIINKNESINAIQLSFNELTAVIHQTPQYLFNDVEVLIALICRRISQMVETRINYAIANNNLFIIIQH